MLSKYAQNHLTSSRHQLCACFKPHSSHPCPCQLDSHWSSQLPTCPSPLLPHLLSAQHLVGRYLVKIVRSCPSDVETHPTLLTLCGAKPGAHNAHRPSISLTAPLTSPHSLFSTHTVFFAASEPGQPLSCPGPWGWPLPLPRMPFVQHLSQFPLLPFAQMSPSW